MLKEARESYDSNGFLLQYKRTLLIQKNTVKEPYIRCVLF